MARGGAREGSGRKAGTISVATRRTRAIADEASVLGISPLEVMLDNMRHFQQVAIDAEAILAGLTAEEFTGKADLKPEDQFKLLLAEVKKAAGFRQMAHDCATDCAPYIHPRLQAVQHSGDPENPVAMTITWKSPVKESSE
jgi:hypothetical protein